MFRLLLRPILLLTLLATLPIILIRAQPYDDSVFRIFLTPPEGCLMPCFMGIRPGVTTLREGLAILESNDWVMRIERNDLSGVVVWRWTEKFPAFLITQPESLQFPTFYQGRNSRVIQNVFIPTRLRLGDVIAAFGQPSWAHIFTTTDHNNEPSGISVSVGYEDNFPVFGFWIPSRTWFGKLQSVLDTEVTISYRSETEADRMIHPSLLDFLVKAKAAELTDN